MGRSIPTLVQVATRLLRCRFDTPEQLVRHLHRVGRLGYLFFANGTFPLPTGTRVVVEVGFASVAQRCVLHGQARLRERGSQAGVWLELPVELSISRRSDPHRGPERSDRRLSTEELVELRGQGGKSGIFRLLDFSPGGVRVSGLPGKPRRDQRLEVRLFASKPGGPELVGPARLAWSAAGGAGLQFLPARPPLREAIQRTLLRLVEQWASARQSNHARDCRCSDGGECGDPPLPEMLLSGASLDPGR